MAAKIFWKIDIVIIERLSRTVKRMIFNIFGGFLKERLTAIDRA